MNLLINSTDGKNHPSAGEWLALRSNWIDIPFAIYAIGDASDRIY